MKAIIGYIRRYFSEEIKWTFFLAIALFMALCIGLEYRFEITDSYIEHDETPIGFWKNVGLYGLAFGVSYLLYIVFYGRYHLLRNREFLFLCLFSIAIYAFRSWFSGHRAWIRANFEGVDYYYYSVLINQWVSAALLFVPVFLFWVFRNRREQPFYGFKLKGVDLKPYFMMLVIMTPLIGWAATQQDFLSTYPVAGRFSGKEINPGRILFFEFSYAVDFAMNELFFRGFLVLAFAKYVGRGAILPMVSFYVFIHFGKPMGETISSFFGGLILGIIAFETRSILGGIIAHVGVAWMMEGFGGLGRWLFLRTK